MRSWVSVGHLGAGHTESIVSGLVSVKKSQFLSLQTELEVEQ